MAFYLDRAVMIFGKAMEADVEAAGSKRKTERGRALATQSRMNAWLQLASGFRDPAAKG